MSDLNTIKGITTVKFERVSPTHVIATDNVGGVYPVKGEWAKSFVVAYREYLNHVLELDPFDSPLVAEAAVFSADNEVTIPNLDYLDW